MKRILKALLYTILTIFIIILSILYLILFFINRTLFCYITLGLSILGVNAFIFWKFYEWEGE